MSAPVVSFYYPCCLPTHVTNSSLPLVIECGNLKRMKSLYVYVPVRLFVNSSNSQQVCSQNGMPFDIESSCAIVTDLSQ